MDVRLINLYIDEIVNQADAAMYSAQSLNDLFQRAGQPGRPGADMTGVFVSVQGILTAGALISKILWMSQPQRAPGCNCPPDPEAQAKHDEAKARCKRLRKELGISGDIPELSSRRVRNGFEHIDDRLDTYFAGGSHFVDRILGPPTAVVIDDQPARVLRRFDPRASEVTVLDDSISLQALLDAIKDVALKAQRWQAENPRAMFGEMGTK